MTAPGPLAQASPAVRRTTAVGLLLALLLIAAFWVVLPLWQDFADTRASADEYETALQKIAASGRDPAALEAELARLKANRAAGPGLLAGPTDALASAQLQTRLKTATETVNGVFRSVQTLPVHDEGPFRRVAVRAQMTVRLGELLRILHDLESASPFLFLDQVSVRAVTTTVRAARSAPPGDGQEPNLEVGFEVYGYVRKPLGRDA